MKTCIIGQNLCADCNHCEFFEYPLNSYEATIICIKGELKSYMDKEKRITGDVLVIGGGMAGCFAAVMASRQGADVILVDKGYIGKSGQSPYSTVIVDFDSKSEKDFDDCLNYINKTGEYINNRYWTEKYIKDSHAICQELRSWGLEFIDHGVDDCLNYVWAPKSILKPQSYKSDDLAQTLRNQVIKSGVKILERVMITELLKQEGRIVGAVGITMDSDDILTFITTTTILCVGSCGFKPAGYPAVTQLTGDGEAMAYRAGAEIGGKEFVDVHFTYLNDPCNYARKRMPDEPGFMSTPALGQLYAPRQICNAEGDKINGRPFGASEYPHSYLQLEFEAHAGKAPIYWHQASQSDIMVGGAAHGMSVRKADGLWPANSECASNVPSLYAAGDTLYTMQTGVMYTLPGSAVCGSAVTGTIAGTAAAKESLGIGKQTVDEGEIERGKRVVLAPTDRQGGFSPRWVTQLLQNTMMPYFVYYIKKEDRLQAALTMITFMQEHLVPQMFARDSHELRLAHETKNMVLSAEMRLRSSIFRTESRGNHYREEFPRRDDENWLAWTKIKEEQGEMKLVKVPVPEEWRPDLSKPYEERYPYRFPGE